jgi:hypothetical protein
MGLRRFPPDFLYAGPSDTRMECINATKLHRKSGFAGPRRRTPTPGRCAVDRPFEGYLVFVGILKHFFLDFHVSELVGVEYLATIQTFDVFNVLFTRYHADLWVFAGGVHLGDLSM